MALVKMKRLELVGLNRERKQVLEYLQSLGCVDISDSRCEEVGTAQTAAAISRFDAYISQIMRALEILPPAADGGGMFRRKTDAAGVAYTADEGEIGRTVGIAADIIRLAKEKNERTDELSALDVREKTLEPFRSLDVPPALRKTRRTVIRLGTIEGEHTAEELLGEFADGGAADVYIEVISATKQQTALWILYPDYLENEAAAVCTRLNLLAPKGLGAEPVAEQLGKIAARREEIARQNSDADEKLSALAAERGALELMLDRLSVRRDKYRVLSGLGITKTAFFLTGYVPEELADKLSDGLMQNFTLSVQLSDPEEGEDVPSAFENNALVSPVEGITSDYAMPSPHDIDPNPIMAIFYYFFFGMMFSDAGYGILMMIGCGLLGFGNFLGPEKRRTFKMFFYCGVSTTFWGIMYGSFFGDMIATVSRTFGKGQLALLPVLVDPVQKPLSVLIMSVAFGVVHILTGMAIKMYMTWRDGNRFAAICDTGFWIAVILGICALAGGSALGSAVLANAGKIIAAAAAIGLVLTQGRDKKNPIMKLFGGILSLYDITSIVGDVLSYSRLMALGLATGVIASVINVLGSLGGGGIVGFIVFVAISVFGHSLNFAINMLGAYVHTNRLQYVEFYQKFYEGGGRKFSPFGFKTKYYKF